MNELNENHQLLFTFPEAGVLANISPAMIRKLARFGKLKTVHIGRSVRVPRHELMRLCGINQAEVLNPEGSSLPTRGSISYPHKAVRESVGQPERMPSLQRGCSLPGNTELMEGNGAKK
jgi:hypothetical protein